MKQHYYIAYGSNLNLSQMKHRCPGARLVATGTVKDYELQFRGHPIGSFATIVPKKGAEVPVGVWTVTKADESSLDIYEGFPNHYFKQTIPVVLQDGREITGTVYRMNLRAEIGLPSSHYYATVRQGYADCGLDPTALNAALRTSLDHFYGDSFGQIDETESEDETTNDAYEDAGIVEEDDVEVDPWQMQW